jgi:hypothetical protein
MLLFIFEDEHGWTYEPHGSEIEVWCTTFEGSEVLKASGWRPYEMHRVSRYVHDSLLIDGMLFSVRQICPTLKPLPASVRSNDENIIRRDIKKSHGVLHQLVPRGRPRECQGC